MSLRAIRKRENSSVPYKKHPVPPLRNKKLTTRNSLNKLVAQKLPQRSKSFPDISTISKREFYTNNNSCQLTSKSETDVTKLAQQHNKLNANSINAKSEICIVKILEHRTVHGGCDSGMLPTTNKRGSIGHGQIENNLTSINSKKNSTNDMGIGVSGTGGGGADGATSQQITNDQLNNNYNNRRNTNNERLNDENNSVSVYSTTTSNNSTTILTATDYEHRGFSDTSGVRIPIIGYEIMEERARFTVFKLRVENPFTNDCWLVLRRYTDFVRLHTKLKHVCPNLSLQLPRKKIFGDNFNAVFLDNRVQGLQIFVNSIMATEELRCSKLVRDFFCLDEPPSYSESMEECRAIFEAQEETIAHLKVQINSKNDLILSLQQKLINEIADNEQLKRELQNTNNGECSNCCKKLESLGISNS